MKIGTTHTFEAAHRLPKLPPEHKCHHLHGHNYRLDVEVIGEVDEIGFVMDYAVLDSIVGELIKTVDHKYLNEIKGLENPTTEVIIEWFMDRLKVFQQLSDKTITLRLYETPHYWAEMTR